MKPLAIDLYCGLGGWAEGLLSEGFYVVGFDIERHDYGTGQYPGQLVLQDARTLHGSQFKNASVIVASPPCQKYSYMAMPWKKAKDLAAWYREDRARIAELNELFDTCFRIQCEANESAGRLIPLIVENVRGAQSWVGRSAWNFGSYHLWGDLPALMPIQSNRRDGEKLSLKPWFGREGGTGVLKAYDDGIKQGGDWFGPGESSSMSRRYSSRSKARKAASAHIAKIPFPLARHIAHCYYPL
jgi:hypothetical protein